MVNPDYCGCTKIGMSPICGTDLKTYYNTCAINCSKMKIDHPGKCHSIGFIPNPVMIAGERTY